jgi:hypothetical protein
MDDRGGRDYDGNLNVLFQPDELSEYEYRRTFQRRTLLEPERRLMFAVLEDAIVCFQRFLNRRGRKERQLHEEAAVWIFEPDERRTFSFEFICEAFGLNPNFLRTGLRKWSELNRSKCAPNRAMAQVSRREAQRSMLRY